MNRETGTLLRFLEGIQVVAEGVPRPDNAEDATEVLDSLHPFLATVGGFHDEIVGCFGLIDDCGRCVDCGRLVAPGMWRAHKEGPGCLMAIPFVGTVMWLAAHREGIPVVGNLIWRRRRRQLSAAGGPPVPPPAAGSPESGRIAARPDDGGVQ